MSARRNTSTEATTEENFTIVDLPVERKANPYDGAVAALAAAGEGKGMAITVDKGTTREGGSAEGRPGRTLFQNAARDAGYSARVQTATDNGDGTITFLFKLGAAQKRKAAEAEAESAPVEESPAETVSEFGSFAE